MVCGLKWAKLVAVVLVSTIPVLFAGDGKDCAGHDKAGAAKASAYHAGMKKCPYGTQDCLDHMAAKMKNSGWVGIEMEQDEATGALTITKVVPGSPAEAAGIQPGDQLYALEGVRFDEKNEEALKAAKKGWKPGQTVHYTLRRDGLERNIRLTLAPMPADVLARYIGQHMLEHATTELAAK